MPNPPRRTLPEVRVYISSPGDVAEERVIAQEVVEQFRNRAAYYNRADIRCIRYDDPNRQVPLVANLSPQDAVNRFLPVPRDCDVFIAILRARMGTPLVEPKKADGSAYLSGTEWEIEDALRADSRADVLIYRNEEMPRTERDPAKRAEQDRQLSVLDAFVERLRRPVGGAARGVHRFEGVAEFRKELLNHLEHVLHAAIERAAPSATAVEAPVAAPRFEGNPYPGLTPYGAKLAPVFCGRDAEIAGLRRMVVEAPDRRRLVAVVGVSGSGKSSLAKAGLVPRLREAGWVVKEFRLEPEPVRPIVQALGEMADEGDPRGLVAQWRSLLPGVVDAILAGDKPGLLILIDQFEEALSLPDAARARLVDLIGALRDHPLVRVVLTLRADFLADVSRDTRLAAWLSGATCFVAPPGPAALADIVEEPAARAGFAVDHALRDLLVDRAAGAAGALPLVCFTLRRLVEAARGAGETTLRLPPEAGGDPLGWALAEHIAATEDALGEDGRAALPALFRLLVRVGDDGRETKRRAEASQIAGPQAAAAAALVAARLLARLETGDMELAHEALLAAWPTLAAWVAARRGFFGMRDEIERQRRRWVEGAMDDARLLPHWLIDEGFALEAGASDLLTVDQRDFLARSRAERDAFWARDSQRLGELAVAQSAAGDHVTAALLALEGLPDAVARPDRPLVSACFSALLAAERQRSECALLEAGESVNSVAFSPDGARLATGSTDRTARLWNPVTGQEITRLEGHKGEVWSVAFSPDGERLATASADRTARLWDLTTGQEITRLDGHMSGVASVAFSPDGARLATGSNDRTARLWDPATTQETESLVGHKGEVWSVAFSPDGAWLATGSDDRTARLWDLATGQEIARLDGHESGVWSVAFSPDGARLATCSTDRTARLWDLTTGQEIARLDGHQDWLRSVAFSPDGARLATGSDDRTARLWDLATVQEIARLDGHEDWSCPGKVEGLLMALVRLGGPGDEV